MEHDSLSINHRLRIVIQEAFGKVKKNKEKACIFYFFPCIIVFIGVRLSLCNLNGGLWINRRSQNA